jgi:hypothetical protein
MISAGGPTAALTSISARRRYPADGDCLRKQREELRHDLETSGDLNEIAGF